MSLDVGSPSVDNGGEKREQNNYREDATQDLSQCQKEIDCLIEERGNVPTIQTIMSLADNNTSDLIQLCRKYTYNKGLSSHVELLDANDDGQIDFQDIDTDQSGSVDYEEAEELRVLIFDGIDNKLLQERDNYLQSINTMKAQGVNRLHIWQAKKKLISNDYKIMTAQGRDIPAEYAQNLIESGGDKHLALDESTLKSMVKVIKNMELCLVCPAGAADFSTNLRDLKEDIAENNPLSITYTKEFLRNYDPIKKDFLSSLSEYQAAMKEGGYEYSTRTQDVFFTFNQAFQALTLFIYHNAVQSDVRFRRVKPEFYETKKKELIATTSTDIVEGIAQHQAFVQRDADTMQKYDKHYFNFFPYEDAERLVSIAQTAQNVLSPEVMARIKTIEDEMDGLLTTIIEENEKILKRQIKVNNMLKPIADLARERRDKLRKENQDRSY